MLLRRAVEREAAGLRLRCMLGTAAERALVAPLRALTPARVAGAWREIALERARVAERIALGRAALATALRARFLVDVVFLVIVRGMI